MCGQSHAVVAASGSARVSRDVAVDQTTVAMLDHDKHIQLSECRGNGDEEIARNDSLGVQTKEGPPAQIASGPTSANQRL
jgi:hypothetical protein